MKARVPAWYLIQHAELIKKDLLAMHWQQVEAGTKSADDPPDLPALTCSWL